MCRYPNEPHALVSVMQNYINKHFCYGYHHSQKYKQILKFALSQRNVSQSTRKFFVGDITASIFKQVLKNIKTIKRKKNLHLGDSFYLWNDTLNIRWNHEITSGFVKNKSELTALLVDTQQRRFQETDSLTLLSCWYMRSCGIMLHPQDGATHSASGED